MTHLTHIKMHEAMAHLSFGLSDNKQNYGNPVACFGFAEIEQPTGRNQFYFQNNKKAFKEFSSFKL